MKVTHKHTNLLCSLVLCRKRRVELILESLTLVVKLDDTSDNRCRIDTLLCEATYSLLSIVAQLL